MAVPFPVCWLSCPRSFPGFSEGLTLFLFLPFPPDSAAVDAVHGSVGPHDGGCPASEREVVTARIVQGHQWGWKDHSKPTFPSPCHFAEQCTGRCGTGVDYCASETPNLSQLIYQFPQSLNLVFGLDFLLWPLVLVRRFVSSMGCAKTLSIVLPTGGILTHSADFGRCGQ
jgi:hypothetical protein